MRVKQDVLFSSDAFQNSINGVQKSLKELVHISTGHSGIRAHVVEKNTSHWITVVWKEDTSKMVSAIITSVNHATLTATPLNFTFK
jgi:hypothetical protein